MSKKKKMIDIDTLLEDELEDELVSRNSDMVFITANEEAPAPTKRELSRIERIEQGRVNVHEPLFDEETNLDFGKVTIGNEEDAQLINKELLEKQTLEKSITDSSHGHRDTMVAEMTGDAPEELITVDSEGNVKGNKSLEADILDPQSIKKEHKRADSRAVQEILAGLMRT